MAKVKTIHAFDKVRCKAVSADVIAELQAFAAARGLKVSAAGGSYDDHMYTTKVRFEVLTTKSGVSAEQADFEDAASLFGFKPTHYGKKFQHKGMQYQFVGFKFGRKFNAKTIRLADGSPVYFQTKYVASLI